jgi:hypothetical protein
VVADHQRRLAAHQNRDRSIRFYFGREVHQLRQTVERRVDLGVQPGILRVSALPLDVIGMQIGAESVDLIDGLLNLGAGVGAYLIEAGGDAVKAVRQLLRSGQNRLPGGTVGRRLAPSRKLLEQVAEGRRNSVRSRKIESCLDGGEARHFL